MIGGPYVWMAAAIVFLVSVGGALWKGFNLGESVTRAEYASRDLQASEEARIAERGIQDRYRAQETKWAHSFASVSSQYQKKVADHEKALDIAISGSRLYDRFATHSQPCGDKTASTAASASVGNGQAGTYFSSEASIFLRRLASEADSVVLQLTACQAILRSERE